MEVITRMMKVELIYNPFTVDTQILIDGSASLGEWTRYKSSRLQMWINELFDLLEKDCRDDIQLKFRGTELDYHDIEEAREQYLKKNRGINIILDTPILSTDANSRLCNLKKLFNKMQRECPFEELCTEQIKKNFNDAIGSEFQVSVIGTMSSGKSTLINAMLGRELMPSENMACTANVVSIKDNDLMENFSADFKDEDNNIIYHTDHLTLEMMKQNNKTDEISFVDIEGDIPFVPSHDIQLVLQDTPGPNNARKREHGEHTYRVIEEQTKSMVLYVLNATQTGTDDNDILLTAVAKAMKVNGKQSKDRFIFVLSKIDIVDVERESIEKMIEFQKGELTKHGIDDPNIYVISAEYALIQRLNNRKQYLTKSQKRTLDASYQSKNDERLHYETYAKLSPTIQSKLSCELNEAQLNGDIDEMALIHTGVPALEMAINEYLEKYALTNKVKTAVDTFISKIEGKQLMKALSKSIESDENEQKSLKKQIDFIKQQRENGKKAQEFRNRIKQLDFDNDINKKFRSINANIINTLGSIQGDSRITRKEAEDVIKRVQKKILELQKQVKVELESAIRDSIINSAEAIMKEYKNHLESFAIDNTLTVANYTADTAIKILLTDVPNTDELINRFAKTEIQEVVVGEKTIKNPDKQGFLWFLKFWNVPWFQPDEITVPKTELQENEYIDGKRVLEEYFTPINKNFQNNIEDAKREAKKQGEEFKKFFTGELAKLDQAMDRKIEEMNQLIENRDKIGSKIHEEKSKEAWLEKFVADLDKILSV